MTFADAETQIRSYTLTDDQLAQVRRDGYLAIPDLLSPGEVAAARTRMSRLVADMVARFTEMPAGNVMHDATVGWHVQFEPQQQITDLTDPELELKIRKLMGYTRADDWFRALAHEHPRLRGVLESILGPASVLFQDMALVKPPRVGSEKPWHQDNAYFRVTPLEQVVGVWIALDEATVENGCMHVLQGGHLRGPLRHYHDRDCEIVPDRLGDCDGEPIPLPAGGALFFYGMLPHRTPPNTSNFRRRALQLHYRGADTIQNEPADYDRIFAEADGSPASCSAARDRDAKQQD